MGFDAGAVVLLLSLNFSLRLFGNHNRHFGRTNHWVIYKRFWLESLFGRILFNTYSYPAVIWFQSFINRHLRNPHCPFHIQVHYFLDFFPWRLIQTWLRLAVQELGSFGPFFLHDRDSLPGSSWWLFEIIILVPIISDLQTHSFGGIFKFLWVFLLLKRVDYWTGGLVVLRDQRVVGLAGVFIKSFFYEWIGVCDCLLVLDNFLNFGFF